MDVAVVVGRRWSWPQVVLAGDASGSVVAALQRRNCDGGLATAGSTLIGGWEVGLLGRDLGEARLLGTKGLTARLAQCEDRSRVSIEVTGWPEHGFGTGRRWVQALPMRTRSQRNRGR